jgi:hypothetical protein
MPAGQGWLQQSLAAANLHSGMAEAKSWLDGWGEH